MEEFPISKKARISTGEEKLGIPIPIISNIIISSLRRICAKNIEQMSDEDKLILYAIAAEQKIENWKDMPIHDLCIYLLEKSIEVNYIQFLPKELLIYIMYLVSQAGEEPIEQYRIISKKFKQAIEGVKSKLPEIGEYEGTICYGQPPSKCGLNEWFCCFVPVEFTSIKINLVESLFNHLNEIGWNCRCLIIRFPIFEGDLYLTKKYTAKKGYFTVSEIIDILDNFYSSIFSQSDIVKIVDFFHKRFLLTEGRIEIAEETAMQNTIEEESVRMFVDSKYGIKGLYDKLLTFGLTRAGSMENLVLQGLEKQIDPAGNEYVVIYFTSLF